MVELTHKEELEQAYAKHRLGFLSGYGTIKSILIPEIPITRELFPNKENDYWHRIDVGDDKNGCIYTLEPRGVFYTHSHPMGEKCKIITEGAEVEWVTERNITFHTFNDTVCALENENHALVSHVDFPIDLLVIWEFQFPS